MTKNVNTYASKVTLFLITLILFSLTIPSQGYPKRTLNKSQYRLWIK